MVEDSGDHRLSRQRHYHGPDGLNGRVRNGNGWDPVSMFAGKALGKRSSLPSTCQSFTFVWSSRKFKPRFSMGMTNRLRVSSRRVVPVMDGIRRRVIDRMRSVNDATLIPVRCESPRGAGGRIGVVKRSAVRTGRLRRSLAVHSRPIDLVVFQEPSHLRAGNLVLKRASRLDAFSAYPFPT